ncbi:MAG: HD domain-containing protein, partial [Candidatus Tectomicrobia bacterium]|nr:HD domain-containing protein [Candidatus Tectomicrobia bacterium]
MKFIRDFEPEDQIVGFFRVSAKQLRETRAGKPYLDLKLSDKTGEIPAKMWEDPENRWDEFGRGDVVKVQGRVELYENNPQLVIQRLRAATEQDREHEYDPSRFTESTEYDADAMWEELLALAGSLGTPLDAFVRGVLEDRREALRMSPASAHLHHPFLGGLLEHTLSVARSCNYLAGKYPVRRDLLLAGAILHDIGKVEELRPSPENEYTTPGRLIGHVVQGWEIARDKARELGTVDEETLMLLGHLILSHQGRPEWSSPRIPQTLEALVLHYADDLDAKVQIFRRTVERDTQEGDFTAWHRTMGREFYKPTYLSVLKEQKDLPPTPPEPVLGPE